MSALILGAYGSWVWVHFQRRQSVLMRHDREVGPNIVAGTYQSVGWVLQTVFSELADASIEINPNTYFLVLEDSASR